MFSLREHARRGIRLATIAAVATAGIAGASADAATGTLEWDPTGAGNFASPAGGAGTFDNSTTNFVDSGDNQVSADTNADVHFAGSPGAVTVPAGTVGAYMALTGGVTVQTLSLDVGGYTISGGPIITGLPPGAGADGSGATLAVANTAGNNTINSDLYTAFSATGAFSKIDVAPSTSLTVNNLSVGNYGGLAKTGGGTLVVNGIFRSAREGSPGAWDPFPLSVNGGTMLINSTDSTQALTTIGVLSGATLGGTAKVHLIGPAQLEVRSGGILSPATKGTSGTFATTGGLYGGPTSTVFRTGSHFEIDLTSPDTGPAVYDGVHDVYRMSGSSYGPNTFDAENGTLVDINNGLGSLIPGTYHIIQFYKTEPAEALQGTDTQHTVDLLNNGFVTGNVPGGYTYAFVPAPSSGQNNLGFDGIDLVVTASAIPEPASLGLLGMGAGLLLLRKRRLIK